jgi:hypothetical protein
MSICRGRALACKQTDFADLLLPLAGLRFSAGFPSGSFLTNDKALSGGGVRIAQRMTISCGELSPNQRA